MAKSAQIKAQKRKSPLNKNSIPKKDKYHEKKPDTLYDKALDTVLSSRFVAKAETLSRPLTDEEVVEEAKYQLEDLPYKGLYEGKELAKAKRQMKRLIR